VEQVQDATRFAVGGRTQDMVVRSPDEGVPRRRGGVAVGRAIVVAVVAAAGRGLVQRGRGVSGTELATSWQLVDLDTLGSDPLGSVWYLHTQPPLHNLLVGLIAWLPVPLAGTLFALYLACLAVTGLLLQDLLLGMRRGEGGIHPTVAGAVAALALVAPALLSSIRLGSYEVPVAMLLVATLWAGQRLLRSTSARAVGGWLIAISALLTLACLTRSLLHPLWVFGALGLLLLACRAVVAAALLPLVLVGGWTVKNQALFGEPTLSSWLGFNLQRGVTAPMAFDDVKRDVADGAVSPLAGRYPWGFLDQYADVAGRCTPRHDHPAVAAPTKVTDSGTVANYNHECYLPLYGRAQDDALTLARRHPGRYLRTRASALTLSATSEQCGEERRCTWMDGLYRPLLVPVDAEVPMGDWNLPLLGTLVTTMDVRPSLTLALALVVVLARGAVATVRIVRGSRPSSGGDRDVADELVWALVAWTVVWVVLAGDLVEIGENGRFRAVLDPLLVALPLAAALARARTWAPALLRRVTGGET
jgi:hypothetical protein